MTATDELRRLLDERGVEYGTDDGDGCEFTEWEGDGYNWVADSRGGLVFLSPDRLINPEQAVEATLRRGTCCMHKTRLPFVSDSHDDGYYMICSECGFAIYMRRIWAPLKYCSHCGRKVVAE